MEPEIPQTEPQLLIYAQDLNDLQQQQRQQLRVLQQLYVDLQIKEQNRAELMSQLMSAQEGERKRVASDIHDGPLQDLGVLLLSIERCKRQLEAGLLTDALETLSRLRRDVQQEISTLRTMISDLRPPVLDTIGLLGAIDYLAGRVGRETNITINVSSRLGSRLDPTLEVLVFRLVQEGLTNIRKHARARHAWVRLERSGDRLLLEIRDDGRGFAVDAGLQRALLSGHIGLASMYERAESAGGRLVVDSAPRHGTVLAFELPFLGVPGEADPALPLIEEPRV